MERLKETFDAKRVHKNRETTTRRTYAQFLGESRHELVARLPYQFWERQGMPLGSPEFDWFAAEKALYESPVASGSVLPFASDRQQMERALYS